jgi:hypothetical protein
MPDQRNTRTVACPECCHPMALDRIIPAAIVVEFVVEHRILSANRFDPATVVVSELGAPSSDEELARLARTRHAERFGDDVQPSYLTARQTRKRIQQAERIMACANCGHSASAES